MTKTEFINKTLERFAIKDCNKEKLSKQLDAYKDFLQTQNLTMNLTRLDSDDIIWSKYFWQSIMVYEWVNFEKVKTILDVGSGSGIPGIVLKLFYPNVRLTIIESSHKKCEFLKQLVDVLHLSNVEILCQRIEETSTKRQFDLTTAKAVAPLEITLEYLIPFTKIGGFAVVPKGKNYLKEVKDLKKEVQQLGGKLDSLYTINDDDGIQFNTIYIEKIAKTNAKYPRDYKKIIKGFDYGK